MSAIHVFVYSLCTPNINCFVLCVLFCSVLLSSHGPDGPELFMIDPSGVSWVKKYLLYNCKACSSNRHKFKINI